MLFALRGLSAALLSSALPSRVSVLLVGNGCPQTPPQAPSISPRRRGSLSAAARRCMNINWASRAECNLCQTKNPKLTEEKREGRAGGHYERQEVATRITLHDTI